MVCPLHPGAHAGSKIICGNFARIRVNFILGRTHSARDKFVNHLFFISHE